MVQIKIVQNLVMNQKLDTRNYLHENNKNAKNEIKNKMENYSLIDVWRELNPTTSTKFTWIGKSTNPKKYARLDYFLISNSLFPFIKKASMEAGILSDHSITTIEIDFRNFQRGRGFWKFNNSLLKDLEYLKRIKNSIKKVIKTYATNDITENFIDEASPEQLQNIPCTINPQLLYDMIQLEIRGETIKYSAAIKKEKNSTQLKLLHQLEELEAQAGPDTPDATELLQSTRAELENIFRLEAEGAAVRARAKYKLDGEKATRLFCNLEKYNGTQKFIPQLIIDENGTKKVLDKQNEIELETKKFYTKLFSNHDHVITQNIEEFLGPSTQSLPKLSDSQSSSMNGHISLEEMTRYLKKSRNNVSPGSSGFTGDFYNFFWLDIKLFVVRSANYSFDIGSLSIQQRLGIITLLPKGSKDKRYLANWRPLTLLNTFYKLVSGCITERIKPALDKIIHPDQKGFVAGRYIGEVVRTVYDTIDYAKNHNKTGLLLLVDFEKAFDSISFKFIENCLKFLNFSDDLIKWVNLLLHNFQASINHCGNISPRFNIGRGCRQGDPIAAYLFIIAVELLAHKLRTDTGIKGFDFGNLKHVLDIYADDLTIYLDPCEQNLKNVLKIIRDFFHLSCLKISVTKTKAIWFGNASNSDQILCPEEGLVWTKTFTLLGLEFDNKLELMDQNYYEKIKDIEKLLQGWLYRYLSPYGKIVVIKALALSKLSHIALVVPSLTKNDLQKLEKIFFNFLWSNKTAKVSKVDCYKPLNKGGLAMVDVATFWQSLKCSWTRRLLATDAFWPKILEKNLEQLNLTTNELLFSGPSTLITISKKISNKFWQNFLISISNLQKEAHYALPENFYLFAIFNNPLFKTGKRCLARNNFGNPGHKISQVADLFLADGQFCALNEINTKFGTKMTPDQLARIRTAITSGLTALNLNIGKCSWHQEPRQSLVIQIAMRNKKGCRGFYQAFRARANDRGNPKYESKWHSLLGSNLSVTFWDNAWRLHASIKNNNPFKWVQCQILRNSIFTNNRVSKFKPSITDQCDFCNQHIENPLTLFTQCNISQQFWMEVKNYFLDFTILIPTSRLQLLFGVLDEAFDSHKNTAIMIGKRVIWASKYKKNLPNLKIFKTELKDYLVLLKLCHSFQQTSNLFYDQWGEIFNDLLGQQHAPQVQDPDDQLHGEPQQEGALPDLLRQEQVTPDQPHTPVHSSLQQADDQAG